MVGLLAVPGGLTAFSTHPLAISPRLEASSPWLDRLNLWRSVSGVPALTENTTWSAGDYDHSQYMVMNDLVTHYETSGTPYYTTAGDAAARASNIFVSSSTGTTDPQSIDWWMAAPFHAMGMMDPRLTATGFGSYRYLKSGWQMGASLDVLDGNPFTGGHFPVFFPGNGTVEPLTTYGGNEFPDPLQACPGYAAPTGLPVFVEVGGNVSTTVTASSFKANGVALAHCVVDATNATLAPYLTSRGGAILIPQQPLVTGVTYTASMTVNGTAYTWSFTVGPFSICNVSDTGAPMSPATSGTSVDFMAEESGCPNPLYEFWIWSPGASSWTLVQPYSTSSTYLWKTAGLLPGVYQVAVWARDASSSGTFSNSYGRYDGNTAMQFTLLPGCSTFIRITLCANSAGTPVVRGGVDQAPPSRLAPRIPSIR